MAAVAGDGWGFGSDCGPGLVAQKSWHEWGLYFEIGEQDIAHGKSVMSTHLIHMVALRFMQYNYCRAHQTLRVTPAMQAGLTDHVWEIEELVGLLN